MLRGRVGRRGRCGKTGSCVAFMLRERSAVHVMPHGEHGSLRCANKSFSCGETAGFWVQTVRPSLQAVCVYLGIAFAVAAGREECDEIPALIGDANLSVRQPMMVYQFASLGI